MSILGTILLAIAGLAVCIIVAGFYILFIRETIVNQISEFPMHKTQIKHSILDKKYKWILDLPVEDRDGMINHEAAKKVWNGMWKTLLAILGFFVLLPLALYLLDKLLCSRAY